MSILLESLNQSQGEERNSVPSVDDSHFDDEMMSDEWLLAKVKFWRYLSFSLLALLIISLAALFFVMSTLSQQQSVVKLSQAVTSENARDNNQDAITAAASLHTDSKTTIEPKDDSEQINDVSQEQGVVKQAYKPTKKSTERNTQNEASVISAESNNELSVNERESQVVVNSKGSDGGSESSRDNKEATEFEGLSNAEKSELPTLEISSYAVSSNPNKSFVVLNGSFYGPGETIAPHLTLVSINKEGIVVRYKGRLISKKYSL